MKNYIKHFTFLFALISIKGTIPINSLQAEDAKTPPNILVIILDDAGWRDVSYIDNRFIQTPNLDRLARKGTIYTHAYSTHAFCAPARQSLISGQWPARTAWRQRSEQANPNQIFEAEPFSAAGSPAWTGRRPEFVGIAQALREYGYMTAQLGKWHFGINNDITPESLGFHHSFGGDAMTGAVRNFFAPFEGLPGDVESTKGEYLTDRLTQETIDFIRNHRESPFYVQLWHYAPHTPIQAPEAIVEKYREKRAALGDDSLNPTYAAMMHAVDVGVGKIVDELEELGLLENTVIFFSSDNGGVMSLGSIPVTSMLPLRDEKGFTYGGGLRVPMFMTWLEKPESVKQVDDAVSLIDFYPTILDLAGVPLPENQIVDGISLTPSFKGDSIPKLEDRPLFWHNVTSGAKGDGRTFQPVAAVLRGDWRLVMNFERPLELYNIAEDYSESTNLSEQYPDKAEELAQMVDDWLNETGVVRPTPNPNFNPDFVIPRQIETLDSLTLGQVRYEWSLTSPTSGWSPRRMVNVSYSEGFLRMRPDGVYPEIGTDNPVKLNPGTYLVELSIRVPTSGRIRMHVQTGNPATNNTIEFYPERDGRWETLNAVFESFDPVRALRMAGPTHLYQTGHYDPNTHADYIEIRSIRIRDIEKKN